MTPATSEAESQRLLLDVTNTVLQVTPEQFDKLCAANPDLRLEMMSNGELIVMPPSFAISGEQNGELFGEVWYWNKQTELGRVFDSSTGYDFTAIGGGRLSPDVSWIAKSRLEGVSLDAFLTIVPDFLVELRSKTDRLSALRSKMLEYQRLGVPLGLLINVQDKQVEIYRVGKNVEIIESPVSVNCNDVLPGFWLNLQNIW